MKSTIYQKLQAVLLLCLSTFFAQTAVSQPVTVQAPLVINTASEPVFSYIVKKNESFSIIAHQYMTNYADIPKLAAFNQWTVQKKLQPNQVIKIPKSLLKIKPVVTELIVATGDLQLKTAKETSVKPIKAGQLLNMGDTLVTAANGKATIRFADGTTTELQPNSQLKLISVGQYAGLNTFINDIGLTSGRVEVTANPKHQQGNAMRVITPSAVAAVRGTQFRVGAKEAITLEETLEGHVAFSVANEQVMIDQGFGSIAQNSLPPITPKPLLAAPDLSELTKNIKNIPFTFAMPAQVGVSAWAAQITRPDGTVVEQLISQTNTEITPIDMPDGIYAIAVRGQDQYGLQGYESRHQFEVNARPFAPVLQVKTTPFRSLPKFEWQPVRGADSYLVELSASPSFSDKLVNAKVMRSAFNTEQLAPGQYYVRVASLEQSETSAYSQTHTVIYQPLDFVPELGRHEFDFSDEKTVKLTLPELPATLKYEVLLTKDAARQEVVWQTVLSITNADFNKPPHGKYYYSVRYIDDTGIKGPTTTYPIQVR